MEAFADVPQDVLSAISHAPVFSGIGLVEQKMLAEKSVVTQCGAEEIIIEQGEIGDKLYIIMKGQMLVSVKTLSMGWKKVNVLGPGDVVGEIAVLRRIPRTARVSALTACKYLTISAEDFFDVYQYFPAHARDNIQLVMAKRLQELGVYIKI